MADMLGSLGAFFGGSGSAGSGLLDLLGIGTAGAGTVGNIMNQKQRSDQINKLNALDNPTKLAQEVSQTTAPLNQGLVQSVGNTVSGQLAEQGLSQAPGIQATELSQALAPFEQQNQSTALSIVLQQLGIPQSIIASLPNNANIAPIIAMLMRQNNPGGGSSGLNFGSGADPLAGFQYQGPSTSLFNAPNITDSPIDFGGDQAVAA
jgi:hypothetical protein